MCLGIASATVIEWRHAKYPSKVSDKMRGILVAHTLCDQCHGIRTGAELLVLGCWLLVIGYWLLVMGEVVGVGNLRLTALLAAQSEIPSTTSDRQTRSRSMSWHRTGLRQYWNCDRTAGTENRRCRLEVDALSQSLRHKDRDPR